jgi:hypothetical protein
MGKNSIHEKNKKIQIQIVDGQIVSLFPLFEFWTCQRRTAKARAKNWL